MPKLVLKLSLDNEPEYATADIDRIITLCAQHGYEIDRPTARLAWERYSSELCAGWLILPDDDDRVLLAIFEQCDPE